MWIIIAKQGLDKHREDVISELLDQEKTQEPDLYIKKRGTKYVTTSKLSEAQFYKLEVSCKKLIQRFQKSQSLEVVPYFDRFYWVKDFHLSYRKVERKEWNDMCDREMHLLNQSYIYEKTSIEKKRVSFK